MLNDTIYYIYRYVCSAKFEGNSDYIMENMRVANIMESVRCDSSTQHGLTSDKPRIQNTVGYHQAKNIILYTKGNR